MYDTIDPKMDAIKIKCVLGYSTQTMIKVNVTFKLLVSLIS